jgi:hypothetical protein
MPPEPAIDPTKAFKAAIKDNPEATKEFEALMTEFDTQVEEKDKKIEELAAQVVSLTPAVVEPEVPKIDADTLAKVKENIAKGNVAEIQDGKWLGDKSWPIFLESQSGPFPLTLVYDDRVRTHCFCFIRSDV